MLYISEAHDALAETGLKKEGIKSTLCTPHCTLCRGRRAPEMPFRPHWHDKRKTSVELNLKEFNWGMNDSQTIHELGSPQNYSRFTETPGVPRGQNKLIDKRSKVMYRNQKWGTETVRVVRARRLPCLNTVWTFSSLWPLGLANTQPLLQVHTIKLGFPFFLTVKLGCSSSMRTQI